MGFVFYWTKKKKKTMPKLGIINQFYWIIGYKKNLFNSIIIVVTPIVPLCEMFNEKFHYLFRSMDTS